MRIQGHLQNEFEHMDELNLKTHTPHARTHTHILTGRQTAPRLWSLHRLYKTAFGFAVFIVLDRIIGLKIPL